ncbi:MAG TPA: hypothetical protein VLM42_10895, partial [Bryobacteraceae bacterium]|nr:hypothetical protein [Bryobacteraceae bacterium]
MFNSLTTSGTNEVHGALWETYRGASLNALNWMSKFQAATASQVSGQDIVAKKLPFVQNQFGIAAGGPIKKNKLYFFAAYQGLRIRQFIPGAGTTIFTAPELGNPVNGKPTTDADWSDILPSINAKRAASGQSLYNVDNLLKNPIAMLGSSYYQANLAALQYRDSVMGTT